MSKHFEEILTHIQSSNELQFENPVNIISYGSPNLPNTFAEVTFAYFQEQLARIFFIGWIEEYKNRIIAITSFENHQEFDLTEEEIEKRTST